MIKKLQDRKTRAKNRAAKLKGAIDQAFQMAEMKSHQFSIATVSTKKVPPKTSVYDEEKIPSKYWKTPDPVLDKKALADDLKAGESVDGASMTNGGQTIQIRWA